MERSPETSAGKQSGALSDALRRVAGLVAVIAVALALLPPRTAHALPQGGYIIVDMKNGYILGEVRSETRMRPASLTKMMTLYLAFEALEDGRLKWGQRVSVSRHAASMTGQRLGLRRGERMTIGDAVRATAIHSANDAAVVLAEAVGGTESNFVRMMNAKARELDMRATHFGNASGLYSTHQLTTPRDMANLARRIYFDFPKRFSTFRQRSFKYRGRRFGATNALLRRKGVDGVKTGYTSRAGFNLAASALRNGDRVLVVLMGGVSKAKRNAAVMRLINQGFVIKRRLERKNLLVARSRLTPKRASVAPKTLRISAASFRGAQHASTTTIRRGAIETHSTPQPNRSYAALASGVTADIASRLATPQKRTWAVQIGAFLERDRATALLRRVLRSQPKEIAGAYQSVEPARIQTGGRVATIHRVRFSGMDRTRASRLCLSMTQAGSPCVIVPPQGWRARAH